MSQIGMVVYITNVSTGVWLYTHVRFLPSRPIICTCTFHRCILFIRILDVLPESLHKHSTRQLIDPADR